MTPDEIPLLPGLIAIGFAWLALFALILRDNR